MICDVISRVSPTSPYPHGAKPDTATPADTSNYHPQARWLFASTAMSAPFSDEIKAISALKKEVVDPLMDSARELTDFNQDLANTKLLAESYIWAKGSDLTGRRSRLLAAYVQLALRWLGKKIGVTSANMTKDDWLQISPNVEFADNGSGGCNVYLNIGNILKATFKNLGVRATDLNLVEGGAYKKGVMPRSEAKAIEEQRDGMLKLVLLAWVHGVNTWPEDRPSGNPYGRAGAKISDKVDIQRLLALKSESPSSPEVTDLLRTVGKIWNKEKLEDLCWALDVTQGRGDGDADMRTLLGPNIDDWYQTSPSMWMGIKQASQMELDAWRYSIQVMQTKLQFRQEMPNRLFSLIVETLRSNAETDKLCFNISR